MHMRTVQTLAILVGLTVAAHAQTGPRTGGPAPGDFKGTRAAVDLSLTGNLARGVSDRDLVAFRGALTFWTGPIGVFIQPYFLYGDVKLGAMPRVQTDDERYLRALVYYTFSEPFFVYGVTALDASLRRKIDKRVLAGGGIGLTAVHRPDITFLAALGVFLFERAYYEANPMAMPPVPETQRNVVRTSLRLYGRYSLGGHLNFVHDVYLIPAIRDLTNDKNFSDLRAMASGVLEVPIVKGFAGRVAVDWTYEGYTVPGTEEHDLAITFGVSYKNDWTLDEPPPPPSASDPPKETR